MSRIDELHGGGCVGMFLARAELKVFLQEWFARIPEFGITPGEEPRFAPGRASAGLYLPLSWPVGAAA